MKYIVCLLLACLLAVPAGAGSCRVVVRKAAVVEKVVVEKVAAIAVPVVAVATVPYYASYYQPPAPAPQPGTADNGELTNAIKELVKRIDRLERGAQPPTMPPADPPQGKPADPFNPQGAAPLRSPSFAASCVQCHQPGGTGTGANGITLFDGQRNWIPGTEGRAMAAVYAGRMPKGTPFNDQQTGDFMAGIDSLLKAHK